MPFSQVLDALGNLAAIIAPSARPARSLEIGLDFPEPLSPAERAVVGRWISEDGAIRLDLRPDRRYRKRRDPAAEPHRGRYEVDRSRLYFEDDTGLVALGELRQGSLDLGGRRYRKA